MAYLRSINLFASCRSLKSHPVRFTLFFSSCQPRLRTSRDSIGPEIMAPVSGQSVEPAQYRLYGVLYCHGESTGSGHYSVDVFHPGEESGGGEAWLRIDDEVASTVRHEDVFCDHGNDRCAYILFYCRTAPVRT